MRYVSVLSTSFAVPRERRRFAFLVAIKWRFPARRRITLPVPVILNRLATALRVLIPLGRRISITFSKRAGNIGNEGPVIKWYFRKSSLREALALPQPVVAASFQRNREPFMD